MNLQLQPSVIAIEDFASELRRFPASAFEGMQEILNFLACTRVRPETLTPYLHYDRQHYTRNLIDRTSVYELMAICWEIGQASSAHNHRDQNCWMVVPIGRLVVQNYRTVFQGAVSLHVYSRPFDTCVVYSPEHGTCGEIELHFNTEYGQPRQVGR
jgi:hypothetical protein